MEGRERHVEKDVERHVKGRFKIELGERWREGRDMWKRKWRDKYREGLR